MLYLRGQATQLFTFAAPSGLGQPDPNRVHGHSGCPLTRPRHPAASTRRRQAELRALYIEARAELRLEHFGTAVGLLEDLLILDPDYPDAAALRDTAEHGQYLTTAYTCWGVSKRRNG